jgi:predicted DNA-binding transcriptional regulator AlpA
MVQVRRLWSTEDVSEYLCIPVCTLYQWRSKGYGPPARRMGKYLRYRPSDVDTWIESLDDSAA